METLGILRLWAAAAWSDGELHPTEAAALERLIEASDDLTPDGRQQAQSFFDAAPRVDPSEVATLTPASREGVYRAALRIVALDGKVTDSEKAFLDKLRAGLDLDAETLARLDREAGR